MDTMSAIAMDAATLNITPVESRLMTPRVMDYDLANAPPVVRLLADGVRAFRARWPCPARSYCGPFSGGVRDAMPGLSVQTPRG